MSVREAKDKQGFYLKRYSLQKKKQGQLKFGDLLTSINCLDASQGNNQQ